MRIGRLAILTIGVFIIPSRGVLALPVVPPGFSARVVAGGLGVFPQALAVASDGAVYVADWGGGVRHVTPAGSVTSLPGLVTGDSLQGLVVGANGSVFVSSERRVFQLPPGGSTFSLLSENPTRFNARDICGDLVARGSTLFLVGQGGFFPPLWTVDVPTGGLAPFEISPEGGFTALAYDAATDQLIGVGELGLFEIDPTTGTSKMFSYSAPGEPETTTFFDCTTGTARTITINPSRIALQAAVHPTTGDVYFTTLNPAQILRATRGGVVSVFSPSGFDTLPENLQTAVGIAFNHAGDKLYVTDRGSLYEISGDFRDFPCSVANAFNTVTTVGGGVSDAVNDTLKVTFRGPVATSRGLTNRGRNVVLVCPGSTVTFEAESTSGRASCKVNGVSVGPSGTLGAGDTLHCTNKPEGRDTDRFLVREE